MSAVGGAAGGPAAVCSGGLAGEGVLKRVVGKGVSPTGVVGVLVCSAEEIVVYSVTDEGVC